MSSKICAKYQNRSGKTGKRGGSPLPIESRVRLFSRQGWIVTAMLAVEKKKTQGFRKTPRTDYLKVGSSHPCEGSANSSGHKVAFNDANN
jgi:hypothetical protein